MNQRLGPRFWYGHVLAIQIIQELLHAIWPHLSKATILLAGHQSKCRQLGPVGLELTAIFADHSLKHWPRLMIFAFWMQEHSLTFDTVSRSSESAKRFSSASAEEAAVCLHVANSLQSVPPKNITKHCRSKCVDCDCFNAVQPQCRSTCITFYLLLRSSESEASPNPEPWTLGHGPCPQQCFSLQNQ